MAVRTTATLAPPASSDGVRPVATRTVGRRRPLPGSRAVVGGLLVAASAVGLFAAYGAGTSGPSGAYVVAAHDLGPGRRFTAADLQLVRLDLPVGQRRRAFDDVATLVSQAVTADRIEAGELIQSSDVTAATTRRTKALISVPVEPGNAMGGDEEVLRRERVDVLVAYVDDGVATATTVARGVEVSDVLHGDSSLGTNGELTVVLAVDPALLEDIARASARGEITLAVTTGTRR